jgi:hypothetical protein
MLLLLLLLLLCPCSSLHCRQEVGRVCARGWLPGYCIAGGVPPIGGAAAAVQHQGPGGVCCQPPQCDLGPWGMPTSSGGSSSPCTCAIPGHLCGLTTCCWGCWRCTCLVRGGTAAGPWLFACLRRWLGGSCTCLRCWLWWLYACCALLLLLLQLLLLLSLQQACGC